MDYQEEIEALLGMRWTPLPSRHTPGAIPALPGIYLIGDPDHPLAGQAVQPDHIFYVGMTVSVGGLRARLRQFLKGASGAHGHSGGRRYHRQADPAKPPDIFMVAYRSFVAEVRKERRQAVDLQTMGHIACLEYFVMAEIKHRCGREPQLNRK